MKKLSEKAKNHMAGCLALGVKCPFEIGLRDSVACEGDNCKECWKIALRSLRIAKDIDE